GRQRLADPRAVAGFKAAWKEMVFPIVTERSEGARLWDVDGNEFIDITLGFGTNFLGHRPQFVVEALEKQLALGIEIGPQSPMAAKVAEKICQLTGMGRAAFCNTGSEAVTAAIRMARTVTRRDRIALFSGAYHGQFDEVLVRAAGTRSLPVAPGIPDSMVQNVLVLEYGTEESLQVIREQAHTLAAVLIEPVQSRRPEFQPAEFARELRKITEESGTALVFDEVVTGFRTHTGGMQARWGIRADLATYGKVVGGGFPMGIVTGKAEYMDALDGGAWSFGDDSAPEVGMTFFAGTFVRHPLALAAANAVLDHLIANPQLQGELDAKTEAFVNRLNARFAALGAGVRLNRFSSMFYLQLPDSKLAGLMFYHLRLRGVHLWEGRPGFLSTVHTDEDIAFVERVFEDSVVEMQEAGFLPCDRPKLTEAQREVWLAARASEGASCALNESLSLKLDGPLDIARLESSLNSIVARHDALRTTFRATDGTPTVHAELHIPLQRTLENVGEAEGGIAFDLENGPLVRAYLMEHGQESHTLVLSAHHIVCDGWSFGVVLHELAVLYGGDNLPAAPSYSDYARHLEAEGTPETQEYWKSLLTPTPPTLNLPTDRPHPTQRTFAGSRVERALEPEILSAVKALSAKSGATLYTTLLTACGVLLHRLTGQTDIVIGSPAAGQATDGEPFLVGHCVHLLPLRLSLNPQASFTEQLAHTRTLVLDAFEHPAVTFGELVQALNLPREAGRVPLVGATFNLDKETLPTHIGAVKMTMGKNPRQFFQFDLGFNLVENEVGIVIEANYNADILEAETVQRWLDHFATLLREVVKTPETALAGLTLLQDAEKSTLLGWGLGAQNSYSLDKSVATVFAEQVQKSPDAIAVAMGAAALTYAELDVQAKRVARNLIAQGVLPGERVVVALERTPDLIVALLGVLQAGAAYVPLDPGYPEERKQLLLADAGAAITVDADWLTRMGAPEELPLPIVDGEALAYVMYTSGSTGAPKGVAIPHRAILRLVENCDYAPLTSADVVAQVATPAFDAATFELWGALLNGARLEILPRDVTLEPKRFAQALAERKITTMFLTTALFNELAREVPAAFGGLSYLLFGGEAVSPRHVQTVLKAGGPKNLLHVYGPTEATTFATYFEVTEVCEAAATVPIGRPIANTTAFVLDEYGNVCPVGVPGELFLGGPGLAVGYLGVTQKTDERFVQHSRFGRLYKTGDSVRWNTEGYIEFVGRIDGQLKIRGFRIEPGEIEAALTLHPAVNTARVVARAHPSSGEKTLVAYFVPNGGKDAAPTCRALRSYLETRLPAYLVPPAYVPLDSLPLNANGKLDVAALPEPDASCMVLTGEQVQPRTETEKQLTQLWKDVLGLGAVGIEDHFFEIGGHSLLAVRLLTRIEKEFGSTLSLATLFSAPTIAHQAELIDAAHVMETQPFSSLVPLNPGGARPRLYCVHHGYGDLTGYHDLVRRLGDDQPVYGLQARGIDGKEEPLESIEAMAAHYVAEILAFQPKGPYHLTGFSLGGVIAFEMARQLHQKGHRVGLLALLDTYAPIFFQKGEKGGLLSEIASVAADLPKVAPGSRWRYAMNKSKVAGYRLKEFFHRGEDGPELPEEANRIREALRRVEVASRRALENYKPASYEGRAVVFRAQDHEIVPGYDPVLWWSEVIEGGVEIQEVPGNHHAILQEPGVGLLAGQLRLCLNDAIAPRE
ncbi:MAG: amino acid adenylation domain-containing protein, partial [Armatimonas sp.]